MSAPAALILGSGPRVGEAVSAKFAANGYKVAFASRKGTDSIDEQGRLSLQVDLSTSDPKILASVFEKVKAEFKVAPSVVIYNAGATTPPPVEGSALSIPSDQVVSDLNVNVISPYIAAQEAVKAWESSSPPEGNKVFVFTGNICNVVVLPSPFFLTGGAGKAASAYWLAVADGSYAAKGYRFIYADQRFEDGKAVYGKVSGPAHADFYTQLAETGGKDVPWHATFVEGKGYVKF